MNKTNQMAQILDHFINTSFVLPFIPSINLSYFDSILSLSLEFEQSNRYLSLMVIPICLTLNVDIYKSILKADGFSLLCDHI